MPVLNLFLAPKGVCDGVRDVLVDLSAGGLLSPFVWLAAGEIGSGRTRGLHVTNGSQQLVDLDDFWVTGGQLSEIRLCVLVPVLPDEVQIAPSDTTRFAAELDERSGASRVTRIRVLLSRGEPQTGTVDIAVEGWHNLLIAPEDSPGPRAGHRTLVSTKDPADIGRHAATSIAGVTGLWATVPDSALKNIEIPTGPRLRLVRSFYRRLDTTNVESSLRTAVLERGGRLPLPRDPAVSVQYAPGVAAATQSMADRLWTKHANVLKGPRVQFQSAAPEKIGLRAALKMFFQFMWAAIRNAPAAWAAQLAHRVSSGIADRVQSAILGGDGSAFQVIVNGVNSRGMPATLDEVVDATRQISAGLPDSAPAFSAKSDLSDVWRDYAAGALTLADAAQRADGMPPVEVGSKRAILPAPSAIVPGPSDVFKAIPGQVSAYLAVHSAESTDPIAVRVLHNNLNRLETEVGHGLQAGETRNALKEWHARHSASYGAKVGSRLAQALTSTQEEVSALMQAIRQAQAVRPPEGEDARRRMARWIQIALVVLGLTVLAVLPVLVHRDILPLWLALLLGVLLVLITFFALAASFMKSQQELFQQLNTLRNEANKLEADRSNLRTALVDLARLIDGYREYVSWSRALGAFLAAPLGPLPTSEAPGEPIRWGLPSSLAVGAVEPNASLIAETADALRGTLFSVGWLSEPWAAIIGAPFSDPGEGSGSALDQWSSAFFQGRVHSLGAAKVWQQARDLLAGPMADRNTSLRETVLVPGPGADRAVPAVQFVAGVGQEAGVTGNFGSALLTDQSITVGKAAVRVEVPQHVSSGPVSVLVTTQFSGVLMPNEVLIGTAAGDRSQDDDGDYEQRVDRMVF